MLKEIDIKEVYNSEEDDILNDFYVPALRNSVSYDRAVGYFDAKMLVSAARGLAGFVENDGHMRLIVGNTLDEEEYDAIERGYSSRTLEERMEKHFEDILEQENSELFKYQLNTLSWLVQHNRLDVKIALRKGGIHHQKIGIFRDANDDFIVFQGSANETKNALLVNYEVIDVFKGWQDEFKGHYEPHLNSFERLWSNKAKNTLVLDFLEITKRVLSKEFGNPFTPSLADEIELWQKHFDGDVEKIARNIPAIPEEINGVPFELRNHQREALKRWKDNDYKGLFELATGAGKTITAIYAIAKMYESRKGKLFAVISVPYQSLAEQWKKELRLFNIEPIMCYGGESKWKNELDDKIVDFNAGTLNFCTAVVVDATLSSKQRTFSNFLNNLDSELSGYFLFIGDECHHHGTTTMASVLPKKAKLRIGLSATPDRGGDEDSGNSIIKEYYGDIVASYTLADALRDGVLTPYDYHLVPIYLTEDETEEYIELSQRIGKIYAMLKNSSSPSPEQETSLNKLLRERSNIINGASDKETQLKNLLNTFDGPIQHSLFYCAEGSIDGKDTARDQEGIRRIQAISKILYNCGWKTSQFTAREDKRQREQILDDFKEGKIDSLVAMKCLDEGIDIPACNTAFILSSSRNPRQFIQRRGRILRKSPGKTESVIYDFFVTLPLENSIHRDAGRKLMAQELKRIKEFADLAKNKVSVYSGLTDYLEEYDLYHHI